MVVIAGHAGPLDRLQMWLDHEQGIALWLTAIATLGLAVGVVIAWFAVADARRTRHAQLIVSLDEQWNSEAIKASLRLYGTYTNDRLRSLAILMFDPRARQPPIEEIADYESLAAAANLLETIGVLCDERALTHDVVYKVWGGNTIATWRAWSAALPRMRADLGEPDVFAYFKKLGEAMEERLLNAKQASWARGSRADGAEGSGTSGSSSHPSSDVHASESSTGSGRPYLLRALIGLIALSALGRVLARVFPPGGPLHGSRDLSSGRRARPRARPGRPGCRRRAACRS